MPAPRLLKYLRYSKDEQMLPQRLEYLVFAGGGMRGLSYAGALEQLAAQGHDFWSADRQLKGVAGSSIGALFAVCLAARVSIEYLLLEVRRFNMRDILSIDPYRLFYERGLDPGSSGPLWTSCSSDPWAMPALLHELQLSSACTSSSPSRTWCRARPYTWTTKTPPPCRWPRPWPSPCHYRSFSPLRPTAATYADGGLMDNFPMHLFPVETTLGIRSCWT